MATIISVETVVVSVQRTDIVIPDPVVSARWNTNSTLNGLFLDALTSNSRITASMYSGFRNRLFVIGWGSYHGRWGYDTSEDRDIVGIYWPENSAPIYNDFIINPIKDAAWLVPALRSLCWDRDTQVVVSPAGKDTDGTPLYYIGHYEQPVNMLGGYYNVAERKKWISESRARHQKSYDDLINRYIWGTDRQAAEKLKTKALLHLRDITELHR